MDDSNTSHFRPKRPSCFMRQLERGYFVGGRLWLEKEGELYMGMGRAILLERIDQYGSIAAAARSMNLGYRNAWLWIEALNRLAPSPLVEKSIGGVGGGNAYLTEEGKKAVKQYRKLKDKFEEFLEQLE